MRQIAFMVTVRIRFTCFGDFTRYLLELKIQILEHNKVLNVTSKRTWLDF